MRTSSTRVFRARTASCRASHRTPVSAGARPPPAVSGEEAGAAALGLWYEVAAFSDPAVWSNTPAGDPAATPKQTVLTVATTFAAQNPTRIYDVYIDDSGVNGIAAYDRVILVRSGLLKDASAANRAAELSEDEWAEI